MSFPGKTSIAYKVCALLRDSDGMTISEICAGLVGHTPKAARVVIFRAHEEGFIEVNARGEYSLSRIMQRHLDQCERTDKPKAKGQIVPARTAPDFKPLSAKNMPSLALLREPIRTGMSFINGSSGFQVLGYRT